jgi:hypothetical protein
MNMGNELELVAGEERLLFGKLAFCSLLILFLLRSYDRAS